MNTKTLLILVVVIGLGLFAYSRSNLSTPQPAEQPVADQMAGEPAEDAMVKEVDGVMMAEMKDFAYTYSGELTDVTNGEVRGIDTGGVASGIAKAGFADGVYSMMATFEDLPDPVGDDFYEGWIVRKEPFHFISTGELEKVDGVYTNLYSSGEDLTDHFRYVLTLEPNDGDPAPADHIVEGDMSSTTSE